MPAPTHKVLRGYGLNDKPNVILEGHNGELNLWAPDKTWIPDEVAAESTVEGWINESKKDGGFYFKLAGPRNTPQAASNGSSGATQDEYARRPDHPDNVQRMRHTSALSAAPAYYELLRTEDVIPKAQTKAEAIETLKGLIEWLESTYPVPESPATSEADSVPF